MDPKRRSLRNAVSILEYKKNIRRWRGESLRRNIIVCTTKGSNVPVTKKNPSRAVPLAACRRRRKPTPATRFLCQRIRRKKKKE